MLKTYRIIATSCLTAIGVATGMPLPAAAAESSGDPGESAGATPEPTLRDDEIIVTARRRQERLQDVPVAATTFGSQDIQRYATESLSQIATRTPQLVLGTHNSPTGGTINLRGIGSPTSSPFVDQAVSINIDGVQVSQANVVALGLYDVERIEILKGPQTLFFGKNSPGGIISILSANPGKNLEGRLRAGYEFANKAKYVEAMISTPLTETIGLRFDGYYSSQTGWFRNTAIPVGVVAVPPSLGGGVTGPGVGSVNRTDPRKEVFFGRATLAFTAPDDSFDANLKINYNHLDKEGGLSSAVQHIDCVGSAPQNVLLFGLPGPTDCSLDRYYNEPDIPPTILALSPALGKGPLYDRSRQLLISLTANYHPSDAITVTSVTGYYKFDQKSLSNFASGNLAFLISRNDVLQKQFTQEIRIMSDFDGPLNFLTGGYYQHMTNNVFNVLALDNPLSGGFTGGAFSGRILSANGTSSLTTNAYSLFGQLLWDITPTLQFTVGGRYSHERKAVGSVSFPNSITPTTYDAIFTPNRRAFNNFSPDAAVTYKVNPDLTLYAAYRRGFVSGGFDVAPSSIGLGRVNFGDVSYAQETVAGGEIGAKGSLADRQLTFDITAYRYVYKGLQVSAFDATTIGYRLTNAGTAIVKGVELSVQARPRALDGLTLRGGLAYNPAKFGRFPNAPCYTGQSPAAGCAFRAGVDASGNIVVTPITAGQVGNAQDLSGRPLPRNSDWAGNLGASFEQPVGRDVTLATSVDAAYTGAYFASGSIEPRSRQRKAWRLNASIAVRGNEDRWELALIGTNLTQTLRSTSAFVLAGTGGGTGRVTAFDGDEMGTGQLPRTVALQATIRF